MTSGTEAGVARQVTNLSIVTGDLTCRMSFLAVESSTFSVIIWRPAMKHMKAVLEFCKYIVVLRGAEK